MFDRFFALNRVTNVVKVFCINQAFQAVAFCKSPNQSFPMLISAPWQVARDADIQNAVATIGHEINPAASHGLD